MALGEEKRKVLLTEEGLKPEQIDDVEKVLNYLPTDVNVKFECRVEGEELDKIVTGAVVTCFFTLVRGVDDEEDSDSDSESDSDSGSDKENKGVNNKDAAKEKAKKEKKEKRKQRDQKKKDNSNNDVKRYVHAPFFPEKREESWWVVIGESTKYELVGVHKVGGFGKKTEGKIKFLAPAKPGVYSFTFYLICDGYLGCDKQKLLKIQVAQDDNPARVAAAAELAAKAKKGGAKIKEIKGKAGEDSDDYSDEDLPHSDDDDDDDDSYSSSESEEDIPKKRK